MTDTSQLWSLDPTVTYLNHGSFGPCARPVLAAKEEIFRTLNSQPMRFLIDDLNDYHERSVTALAHLLGCKSNDLLLTDNATVAMNLVARNVPLVAGDEVLLTDHEYGSVARLWRKLAQPAGAHVVTATLPDPITDTAAILRAVEERITERTRLLVVSHVTSATAVVLPVKELCRLAKRHGVPIAIDGPHAVGMRAVDLRNMGCDYFCASCHKWLAAPFGSGFLYVHPKHHGKFEPLVVSWGRNLAGEPRAWQDEYRWQGTSDLSSCFAIPAAIELLSEYGWQRFRDETHALAKHARHRLEELLQTSALLPDSDDWYGSMIAVPLPPIDWEPARPNEPDPWMKRLRHEFRIEVPISRWNGHRLLRVSCHLYNTEADIDRLVGALKVLLAE